MDDGGAKGWREVLDFPFKERQPKPRDKGLTMVIDKGLGLMETQELLELGADYIDLIKLGFGTSAFYSSNILRRKIDLVKSFDVDIFPGGTFLEVALIQGKLALYLETAKALGYTCIEVSDGTVPMSPAIRADIIKAASNLGFKVISEVGKKDPRDRVATTTIIDQISEDLENGAYKVIVEGRESGRGVVIYDSEGKVIGDELKELLSGISDVGRIIWEAPLKNQQKELILRFGANVNLGNVHAGDVLALEALRVGLRGDTLRAYLEGKAAIK